MQYQHPNNGAYGGVILSHKELWLGAYDADKKMVSGSGAMPTARN